MTFGWVVTGTVFMGMLAVQLFMFVIFSAASIGNNIELKKHQSKILNICIFLLPALCVVCAGIVIYLYNHDNPASGYRWYAVPFVAGIVYLAYAMQLNRGKPKTVRGVSNTGFHDIQ